MNRLQSKFKRGRLRIGRYLLIGALALTLVQAARAQDQPAAMDKIFSWATASTPGAVVAVSQNGKVVYQKAVGMADLESAKPMELDAVFDIGSTRKQFVAAAILLLASDKKLTLSDDVRRFFPKLPDYGKKITLNHLLTHTSGIRDWTGLQGLAADDPDAMTLIMRQKGLNFAPGEQWSYSNSGYVLLAEIVAKVSGKSFGQFLKQRIFAPLGMTSSSYVMDLKGVVPGRAMAYKKERGLFVKDMLLANDRGGAGALFSTAGDLLIWNEALSSGKLGKQVSEKLMEPTRLNNGRVLNYGRGLVLEGNLIWHSGGAAGYHTWIGRVVGSGISIAVLCNSDQVAASALAERILAIYAPGAGLSKEEAGPPPVLVTDALADAKNFAGLYVSPGGELLRLALDRDRFRVPGGPGVVEVSKGKFRRWGATVFYRSQDRFMLDFVSGSQLNLVSMEGKVETYLRAGAYAPSTAELAEFTGRYVSSEIGGALIFAVGGTGLSARANDSKGEAIGFAPVAKDIFQFAGVVVRFIRDHKGKVISMRYSNPVVQDILFLPAEDTHKK